MLQNWRWVIYKGCSGSEYSVIIALKCACDTHRNGIKPFFKFVRLPRQIWSAAAAFKSWQFYVIAAAYTSFLLCDITVNSFAVAQIHEQGYSTTLAGSLLSIQALINAFSCVVGGILGEFIHLKKRLIISLSLIIVGMIAISQANSVLILFLFTLGIGAGSGMIFLASGVLLTDYFGRQPYLELFSVMNLISTVACFGPLLAGIIKDISGSFTTAFMLVFH
ncbi:MFS transporter [Erwinia tracheiphila]|uniref:MFS transporter n=1 Tax=Erwinia tracheiphila TaxID=65700 RepID=UPI00033FE281|nr:MFS transporter [Erwinia tracheiphila]EOS95943.1 MFS family transporter [Erwinia tracheiphila PSU-1]UIA87125.1 MFS transporter [Erwinia tracheiphila]